MPRTKLLTILEVCEMLHVNRMTCYKMIKSGKLQAINLNKGTNTKKRYRVSQRAIDEYIAQQTEETNDPIFPESTF